MSFLYNIQTVAKYESKILVRSWFFRVFTVLALLVLGFFDFVMLVLEDNSGSWFMKAIAANIPYINLLMLNIGQAVIAVFLSSEFLKRDKKLDTSEVFYVHPLSNAEYVFGKIWGNLRVFLLLNLIIMGIALLFNFMSPGTSVDWQAYIIYFFLISLPTLIFITGLSILLMLIIKNQALTFVILLGYIGLTVFYIGDKFYYVFDYMAYGLPMLKSTIVGFTNKALILNHRAIYLCAGLAFISFTISLFGRLPNSNRSSYPWIFFGACMLMISIFAGYNHVNFILKEGKARQQYITINNKYTSVPRLVVDQYNIYVEQHPESITSEVNMTGNALATSSVFSFCLNPGMKVEEVKADGEALSFTRDHQIIVVDFGREIAKGDSVSLSIRYSGKVADDFCYLDIPEEILQEQYQIMLVNVDKRYAFQTNDYILFTPETYWYPRPGVSYSDEDPGWQQVYFSDYKLSVKPLPGMKPFSQGERMEQEDGFYTFSPEYKMQALSLAVGNYDTKSIDVDSVMFNIHYLKGHDYFSATFDSIYDTIPGTIRNMKEQFERTYKLEYPFRRFSLVEVPAQFHSYPRTWSKAQETVQPEAVFFPEKGWSFEELDVKQRIKNHINWSRWSDRQIDETEAKIRTLNDIFYIFFRTESDRQYSSSGRGNYEITSKPNPYFLFPELYNFRYNIFSPRWSVSNRVIELYLENKSDNGGWERDVNGISNNEKANLLFDKYSFEELLSNMDHRSLLDNIISLKGNQLFANAEINVGVTAFRDSVYAFLKRNTFRNISFEAMLDTLGHLSRTDIHPILDQWSHPTPLPYYTVYQPEITQVINRDKEVFVTKVLISNDSDVDGIIQIVIDAIGGNRDSATDPSTNRKVPIAAHQAKRLVNVWEEVPREIIINTLLSNNLPNAVNLPVRNIIKENNRPVDKEGDMIVSVSSIYTPDEIIVDNEDPLFSLSEPAVVGLLPKWLDRVEETPFKYSGISWWRTPLQWTATTNAGYYGRYIRSAYIIRGGDGSQTATWKVPLASPGHYEVYYWGFSKEFNDNRRHINGEYHFKIHHNEEVEEVDVNVKRISNEWEQLGVFYLDTDTVKIVLSNNSGTRSVTADAVKLVRRQ